MNSQSEFEERIFLAALSLGPDERKELLEEACRGDANLRQRVEALLLDDAQAGSFLANPLFAWPGGMNENAASSAKCINDPDVTLGIPPSAPACRFAPGDILMNRFTIVRFIASGGMGEVYEVEDRFLQSVHVALKTVLSRVAEDSSLQQRFEREVLLARSLNHPNLCPIYDIYRCEYPRPAFSFLTMKLLQGETLAARFLRQPAMHLEETLAILKQLVAGVAAMHDGGVVHRDIKPNNIMLEGSGPDVRLYITDFGLARAHESDVTIGCRRILAGTPAYMAPELFRGAQPSRATDLFALGVVMHQLFLGKKPELVPGSYSVAASSQLSLLDLPSYCIRLMTECLSDDPQRRCRVFDEVRSFLDPRNTPLPLVYRENQSWTRRRFLAIAAGAACAAAGAVWWKNDTLDNLLHPLPAKRFVALLSWPPPSDAHIKPMLAGVLRSIENELSRVEAFDRNLFVTSPLESNAVTSPKQFSEIRDSLGTNLVLAASAALHQQRFHLSLQILDPVSPRPLREKHLSCPMGQETSMPGRAVRAAAELLNVGIYLKDSERTDAGTRSPAAFAAFQAAEALVKQGGDVAVDAAVDEYKRAVELDPHYALAHAQLAIAYLHLYSRRHDPAAISLARGNTETALKLDPDLVEGHLARALLLEDTGDEAGALREYAKALSIDPSNPRTLIYQAQIYDRLNRWEDAEKTYRRVLQERPNYWLAHNELAMVFYAQGKYQEALTEFRSASLAAPRNAMALNNIGATSLQLGNLTEATDSLKKSLELGPSDFAFGSMAAVLRARHKFPEALSFAQRAVKLNPRESLNWLELGDCYSLLGNHRSEARGAYARAADLQEEQLRTNASDGPSWMLLALYKAKAGTPEAAVPLIRKAESLAAGDIQSQLYKARTLEVLGKRDEALTTIADCLRMGATKFQIESTPDLESLRGDLRYQQISSIGDSSLKTTL